MNREAFEKIQHIKDHLEHFDIYYTSLGGISILRIPLLVSTLTELG